MPRSPYNDAPPRLDSASAPDGLARGAWDQFRQGVEVRSSADAGRVAVLVDSGDSRDLDHSWEQRCLGGWRERRTGGAGGNEEWGASGPVRLGRALGWTGDGSRDGGAVSVTSVRGMVGDSAGSGMIAQRVRRGPRGPGSPALNEVTSSTPLALGPWADQEALRWGTDTDGVQAEIDFFSSGGFTYSQCPLGTDSLAFGDLALFGFSH